MICRLCDWRISCAADAGVPLPRWVRRHQARCARCQTEERRQQLLFETLRAEGSRVRQSAAGGADATLHNRIMRAVRAAGREAEPARHVPVPAWVPVAALMALVAAALWFSFVAGPVRHRPAGDVARVSLDLGGVLQPVTETVARWEESPFSLETEALQRDLSSAGQFLLACVDLPTRPGEAP